MTGIIAVLILEWTKTLDKIECSTVARKLWLVRFLSVTPATALRG